MRYHRRKHPSEYILPFLILIGIGVICILIFKLGSYFIGGKDRQMEDKGKLHVAAGRAEVKQWGDEDWTNVYEGSLILEGDILKVAKNSKVAVKFFNNSVIRLNGETEIFVDKLESSGNEDNIALTLNSGSIWVKVTGKEEIESLFSVKTKNLIIRSVGTIFDVQYTDQGESVHVMKGRVRADIFEEPGSERTIDFVDVGVGQQVELGNKEFEKFRSSKSPDVLAALSDDFKTTAWYRWNSTEDKGETLFREESDFEIAAEGNESASAGVAEKPQEEVSESAPSEPLAAPIILRPLEGERTIAASEVLLEGTTDKSTSKIEISNSSDPAGEPYILKSYQGGDEKWSYRASFALGNLKPGKNVYLITAVDKDGNKSPAASVEINYEISVEEAPSELTVPEVSTFNGGESREIIGGEIVAIKGAVGKWAQSVVINDYVLTKYVPGSGEWTYFANVDYGNLLEGENSFKVYAVDLGGRKSPLLEFILIWHRTAPPPQEDGSESGPGEPVTDAAVPV